MPINITKPIVLVCGSRSIHDIYLDRFIKVNSPAEIISGGTIGIDKLAEQWAKRNKIEFIAYLPNYKIYGDKASIVRDKEMVDFCDVVIVFWDGNDKETKMIIDYAAQQNKQVIVHLFEELD